MLCIYNILDILKTFSERHQRLFLIFLDVHHIFNRFENFDIIGYRLS